jgi:hypothetical protein
MAITTPEASHSAKPQEQAMDKISKSLIREARKCGRAWADEAPTYEYQRWCELTADDYSAIKLRHPRAWAKLLAGPGVGALEEYASDAYARRCHARADRHCRRLRIDNMRADMI